MFNVLVLEIGKLSSLSCNGDVFLLIMSTKERERESSSIGQHDRFAYILTHWRLGPFGIEEAVRQAERRLH